MYSYEVLAPAGTLKGVKPLIDAGANAIYVGLDGLSSRPQSADFSLEDITHAVEICHQHNVRLNVALNGCVSEKNIHCVYEKLNRLDEIAVDAVIIADWGVLAKAPMFVKKAELHASTLLGVYNAQTIAYLKKMGIKRTVLSTNLYLDEMAAIVNSVPDMEYEIVADGGICFNDNRICELPHSNERENYTVYCRQAYDLKRGDKQSKANRIAAKQISSSEVIDLYLEMGIFSFKIEGRTVDYNYIVPRVKKLRESLEQAAARNHSVYSTLHYLCERSRMEDPV
ncbi:MAG: peptidase U32 family protein [Blautia sp.]|nr:peptidase U32 family protein [Blautia sp.]